MGCCVTGCRLHCCEQFELQNPIDGIEFLYEEKSLKFSNFSDLLIEHTRKCDAVEIVCGVWVRGHASQFVRGSGDPALDEALESVQRSHRNINSRI